MSYVSYCPNLELNYGVMFRCSSAV